jgi:hypothetical protein
MSNMNRSKKLLSLFETYTPADADAAVEKLQAGIQAAYVRVYKSTIGGQQNASILITVSLDSKETWNYDILENSRYFRMHYLQNGSLEVFSGSYKLTKFRKTRTKNPDDALAKINKYISLQANTT